MYLSQGRYFDQKIKLNMVLCGHSKLKFVKNEMKMKMDQHQMCMIKCINQHKKHKQAINLTY